MDHGGGYKIVLDGPPGVYDVTLQIEWLIIREQKRPNGGGSLNVWDNKGNSRVSDHNTPNPADAKRKKACITVVGVKPGEVVITVDPEIAHSGNNTTSIGTAVTVIGIIPR